MERSIRGCRRDGRLPGPRMARAARIRREPRWHARDQWTFARVAADGQRQCSIEDRRTGNTSGMWGSWRTSKRSAIGKTRLFGPLRRRKVTTSERHALLVPTTQLAVAAGTGAGQSRQSPAAGRRWAGVGKGARAGSSKRYLASGRGRRRSPGCAHTLLCACDRHCTPGTG